MAIKCKRCGQCCTYKKNDEVKRCKYLIGTIGKITSCRIYPNRLGTYVDDGVVCILRDFDNRRFKDCPYNNTY